jgi:hypothetical protein
VSFACSYTLVTFLIHKQQFNLHIYFIHILNEEEGSLFYKLRIFTVRLQTAHTEHRIFFDYLGTLYIFYFICYFFNYLFIYI